MSLVSFLPVIMDCKKINCTSHVSYKLVFPACVLKILFVCVLFRMIVYTKDLLCLVAVVVTLDIHFVVVLTFPVMIRATT